MSRPKLLFLCHLTPFPPDGGAEIRSFHLLRLLAQEFDVTAFCLWRRHDDSATASSRLPGLTAIPGVVARAFPRRQGAQATVLSHARSLIQRRVYTAFMLHSPEYRKALKTELQSTRFDVVHVDSLDLCGYMPILPLPRVVCGHHNVESLLLRRRAAVESSALRRAYIAYQADLMEREEKRWSPKVALNLMTSNHDADALRRVAPGSRLAVVPNGVDTAEFVPGSFSGAGLLFMGGTGWFPNRDALTYFANDILPLVRAKLEVEVTWLGHADEASRALGDRAGITMTGFVDDIRPFVRECRCFVAPLRVGGGTRLKILDAWAMGAAVVSTSIGCEGLEALDGHNILIRDTAAGFADAVISVLRNPSLRRSLGEAARRTAETLYSWDVIGLQMLPLYSRLSVAGRLV